MNKFRTTDRTEMFECYCRSCWTIIKVGLRWSEIDNKTLEEIRKQCNDIHAQQCKSADVRFCHARTKTR